MGDSGLPDVKELDIERGKLDFLHLRGGCRRAPVSYGCNNVIVVHQRRVNLGESSKAAKCELPIGC